MSNRSLSLVRDNPVFTQSRQAASARNVLASYIKALGDLSERINGDFTRAVGAIHNVQGRVIVCGMGKSGHIGCKIAATLASTGTPAFFVHPGEAYHGDLGMITKSDLVILISYSGETEEIVRLLPPLKSFGVPVVSICGKKNSTLALASDVFLDISVEREVCPHNLAPTTSTLATLAIGDALAVTLMEERGFQPNDFARFHPGGSLGRRLLCRVSHTMRSDNLPIVAQTDRLQDIIEVMTAGRLGLAIVMDGQSLKGIITDGDLRRAFGKKASLTDTKAVDIMTHHPLTIRADAMQEEAESRMMENKISRLIVLDDQDRLAGVVQVYG